MRHDPIRMTHPWVRANEDLALSPQQWNTLLQHQHLFLAQNHQDPVIQGQKNDQESRFLVPWLARGMIYLVTETVSEYPWPYLSEKTWKAIVSLRPFMLVAPRHSLRTLKSFGFRTFDAWWDEGYDDLETTGDRVGAIMKQLQAISWLDQAQRQAMLKDMESTLTHNRKHLDVFIQQDIDHIERILIQLKND